MEKDKRKTANKLLTEEIKRLEKAIKNKNSEDAELAQATYEAHFKSKGRWSRNQKPINGKIRLGCVKLIHHHFILQSSHYNFLSPMDTVKMFFKPAE